jgi:GAF domain-containing protein
MNKREQTYQNMLRRVEALIDGETDEIAVMATVACELFHAFDAWNWVGFYRRVDADTLKVGPYQGSHGCLEIDLSRGVCGKCAREAVVQLENDVTALPHHIACSSDTRAELVLPVVDADGYVRAVLDVDSIEPNIFDDVDVANLVTICEMVSERY